MVCGLLKRNSHDACAGGLKKGGGVLQRYRSAVSGAAQLVMTRGEKLAGRSVTEILHLGRARVVKSQG
jgi:hypothetical protein